VLDMTPREYHERFRGSAALTENWPLLVERAGAA